MPKRAMTALAGQIANADAGHLTTFIIRRFVKHYGVNMEEAVNPDIQSYRTFNDFFTRALLGGNTTHRSHALYLPGRRDSKPVGRDLGR